MLIKFIYLKWIKCEYESIKEIFVICFFCTYVTFVMWMTSFLIPMKWLKLKHGQNEQFYLSEYQCLKWNCLKCLKWILSLSMGMSYEVGRLDCNRTCECGTHHITNTHTHTLYAFEMKFTHAYEINRSVFEKFIYIYCHIKWLYVCVLYTF